MFDIVKKSIEWGRDTLTLETGEDGPSGRRFGRRHLWRDDGSCGGDLREGTKAGTGLFPAHRELSREILSLLAKSQVAFSNVRRRPSEKGDAGQAGLIDRPIRPLFLAGVQE